MNTRRTPPRKGAVAALVALLLIPMLALVANLFIVAFAFFSVIRGTFVEITSIPGHSLSARST